MRLIVKVLIGVLVVFAMIVGLIVYQPMTASRLFWPIVEYIAIDADFVGITSDGNVQGGLFSIAPTGESTQPVVDAAVAFIDTLNADQRARVLFPVDDLEWQRWANIHLSARQGVGFLEFDDSQAQAAFNLIASGMSARGYHMAVDIMRLEGHLAELMNNYVEYGEKRYWLTIMGNPSTTEPWGWQLDGHHLIVNFFVLGDQVVMAPVFMGSEPPEAKSGRYAGTKVFTEEMSSGLELINALGVEQRVKAVLSAQKTENSNRGELFQDNAVVAYEGLPLGELNQPQQQLALDLIRLYVYNIRHEHARIKITEIIRHWDETYFAWIGGTRPDAVFYYRIHSPVVMIEFDHQTPIALDGPPVPSRNHVHTTMRTPNGNDYGKDLLRQHLENVPH